jgi:hypothetical protein
MRFGNEMLACECVKTTFPISAVVSMGRRNTRPKPTFRAQIARSRSRASIQTEHHPDQGLLSSAGHTGSPWGSAVGSTD